MDIDDILKELESDINLKRPKSVNSAKIKEDEYKKLVQIWISERMSPELLPYESELIETILKRLRSQVEIIELNSIELEKNDKDIKLKLLIIESEIERINFLVRSYLRLRLFKIDEYNLFINNSDQEMVKLSKNELNYMVNHFKTICQLYNDSFLKNVPEHLQLLDDESGGISMINKPDLDKMVFIKVINEIAEEITVGEDDKVELEKDFIYAIRYRSVKRYIDSKDIVLI
ncbi:DNA replication protein SLD5 [Ascoidea rubescens DSM 1968]|uniref:DNA replication complex GINS protein SLD5 n=1 Tax=Ascoidea rubescens DSM 1968 TaxID=1344418 RepID=A0A1D2VQQ6_9ASCO|nr:subunit of the GINS complex [Ascoidea rubescens DSM 1968]ODV63895.1 subunit of the GINS complex [Ascoidea rubescens DSM 1968]